MTIFSCAKHGLMFNGEEGCAECAFEARIASMPPLAKTLPLKGRYLFRCVCGSRCINPKGCTRYACAMRSGLMRHSPLYARRCANCGGRTKYNGFCTRYSCRQVAGTQSMYNQPR